jgi:biofilm PGA synthesis protein PgaD
MNRQELIIDSPDLQLAPQRRSWAFVKSVGWLLWFMLWLPLFTVLGWYFGYTTIIEQFVDRKGSVELLRLLPTYLLVISVCGGSLVIWSLIQYWRFHGRNKRTTSSNLGTSALAEMTKNSVAAVQSWQGARRVVAYHDANAKIVTVETDPNALYGKALIAAAQAADAMATTSVVAASPLIAPHAAETLTPGEPIEAPATTGEAVAAIASITPVVMMDESRKLSATPTATTIDIKATKKTKTRRTKKQRANGAFV